MTSIMVLDDDPMVLKTVVTWLAAAGADVMACHELEAAEALLEQRDFDTVLTDLNVSERGGLEGMRLIRHVAAEHPDTRIIAMTGLVDEQIEELARTMGVREILHKPIDFPRLAQITTGATGCVAKAGRVMDFEPLESVLAGRKIRSVLQPICALSNESARYRIHAVEALARIVQDTPLYNPGLLFAYAMRKDRVFETDRRCIGAALNEAQFLPDGVRIFLNAHPQTLAHPHFSVTASEMVAQAGFERHRVIFEVTEQHMIGDSQAFAKKLEPIRALGFRIALDDYGSGCANLELLQALSPDYVKLAGVFARGIEKDRSRQIIVSATVDMAERLGIPLIAEWVETEAELKTITALGIPYGQGYYFGQPAPAAKLLESDMVTFDDSAPTQVRAIA